MGHVMVEAGTRAVSLAGTRPHLTEVRCEFRGSQTFSRATVVNVPQASNEILDTRFDIVSSGA